MSIPAQQLDPLAIGKKLLVQFVLAGNFMRSDGGLRSELAAAGYTFAVGARRRIDQRRVVRPDQRADGDLQRGVLDAAGLWRSAEHRGIADGRATRRRRCREDLSEEYLQARAVLSSFMSRTGSLDDLNRARGLFESVVQQDEDYAPGWSGLGITHLQYARHGLGGQMHVLEARRAFDKALQLDPGSVEANLYRVYMLLSRGEKESARHGIEHLLQSAANDWNVHLVAGLTLRIDGMYEEALDQFNTSLRLNPANAAIIYNHRARVYQYQNQLELAGDEIEKGLTLEPRQPLLRISLGYQQMRQGDLARAVETLESGDLGRGDAADCVSDDCAVLRAARRPRQGGELHPGRDAGGGGGGRRDGLSAGDLLRGGWRRVRGAALAAAGDLSGQRKLSVVLEEPGVAESVRALATSSGFSRI